MGTLTKEHDQLLQSHMAESERDECIQSEGADERDLLINFEEDAVIAWNKANLPNKVVDKAPRVNIKPKKGLVENQDISRNL